MQHIPKEVHLLAHLKSVVDTLLHTLNQFLSVVYNAHKHPYTWKKKPHQQPDCILGGFGLILLHKVWLLKEKIS